MSHLSLAVFQVPFSTTLHFKHILRCQVALECPLTPLQRKLRRRHVLSDWVLPSRGEHRPKVRSSFVMELHQAPVCQKTSLCFSELEKTVMRTVVVKTTQQVDGVFSGAGRAAPDVIVERKHLDSMMTRHNHRST